MRATLHDRIVVVGGGPIGLAMTLALANAEAGLRGGNVSLVERQTLALARLPSLFDHRVYALSPGSKALLESLGVWSRLLSARIEPVRAMHVFGDALQTSKQVNDCNNDRSKIEFSEGMPLAFIVEHSALMQALIEQLREQAGTTGNIHVFDNAIISGVEFAKAGGAHQLRLKAGPTLAADLLIAADGASSLLRAQAGIVAETKDYESDGIVVNFRIEQPHGGIARQWFAHDGVLAYLPLPDNQVSIVWSVSKTRADELSALDDQAFTRAVMQAGDHVFSGMVLASPRARFALRRVMATQWVQPGFALIGDAAHAIHPLAGQGANLGFADVRKLFEELQNRSALSHAGDLAVLRRYERARVEDAVIMGHVTDGLRALYLSESQAVTRMRRDGLKVANNMDFAKSLVMAHAMR